jgi:hypothetical protein
MQQPVPPAVAERVRAAGAAAREPVGHAAGHRRRLGRVPPVQEELLVPAQRRERGRWARDDGALAYSVDAVLRTRPNGTVRIGLDITGSSSGTFAARMMERGVTVVTAAVNAGAPISGFIAARGLVPVQLSAAAHRLPFFDGTLDIVHHLGGGVAAPPTT